MRERGLRGENERGGWRMMEVWRAEGSDWGDTNFAAPLNWRRPGSIRIRFMIPIAR
jgi:hypothetical protein